MVSAAELETQTAQEIGVELDTASLRQLGLLALSVATSVSRENSPHERQYGIQIKEDEHIISVNPETPEGRRFLRAINNDPKWDYLKNKQPGGKEAEPVSKPTVIAVVGHSGSGKTQLAERIAARCNAQQHDSAVSLGCDNFYGPGGTVAVDFPDGSTEQFGVLLTTYDVPNSLDQELYRHAIGRMIMGHPGLLPFYDMTTHSRVEGESLSIAHHPTIILDGILLLDLLTAETTDSADRYELLRHINMLVVMDVGFETAFGRRASRDVAERGRTPADIAAQKPSVQSGAEQYVEPLIAAAGGDNYDRDAVKLEQQEKYSHMIDVIKVHGGQVHVVQNPTVATDGTPAAIVDAAEEIVELTCYTTV